MELRRGGRSTSSSRMTCAVVVAGAAAGPRCWAAASFRSCSSFFSRSLSPRRAAMNSWGSRTAAAGRALSAGAAVVVGAAAACSASLAIDHYYLETMQVQWSDDTSECLHRYDGMCYIYAVDCRPSSVPTNLEQSLFLHLLRLGAFRRVAS